MEKKIAILSKALGGRPKTKIFKLIFKLGKHFGKFEIFLKASETFTKTLKSFTLLSHKLGFKAIEGVKAGCF